MSLRKTEEVMDVKRLCALTEQGALLKPKERATRAEVRALAQEILRLRVVVRGARINAQRIVAESEAALVNAPIAGGEKAL